jgi:predicted signal transduction protein with EAL and GGDEF domain
MGASIGVAMIRQRGVTANEVLTAADNAMYTAKRAGKGRAVLAGAA